MRESEEAAAAGTLLFPARVLHAAFLPRAWHGISGPARIIGGAGLTPRAISLSAAPRHKPCAPCMRL